MPGRQGIAVLNIREKVRTSVSLGKATMFISLRSVRNPTALDMILLAALLAIQECLDWRHAGSYVLAV